MNIERRSPTKHGQEAPPQMLAALLGAGGDNSEIITLQSTIGGRMDYVAVPQSHWSPLHGLGENAATIDEKCRKIVGLIKEAFERNSIIGTGVCSLEIIGADNEFATLKTPVGSGRITRTWSHSQRYIQAELIFARERFDEYGRQCWEPVWGLVVPLYDAAYSGTGMDALRFEIGSFREDERHKAFSSAIAMLYGLLSGPLIAPLQ